MFESFYSRHTPELGTNRFAGIGIGARGAKMSAGAGASPPGLVVPPGLRTSTYLLLGPDEKQSHQSDATDASLCTLNSPAFRENMLTGGPPPGGPPGTPGLGIRGIEGKPDGGGARGLLW